MILLNDFKAQWTDIRDNVLSAVDRVGSSGWLILGNEVSSFEEELAKFWRLPSAIGVANGMDAIEISLRALGLQQGDKVLTTPLSAFATTLAIIRAGGVPVFVDTDERGLIDLSLVENELSQDPSIKMMVPVHLFGHSLKLDRLEQIKKKYSVKIVEDCAQCIGARFGDRIAGSIGEFAATSFYPTKNLGCLGDGGAILGSNPELLVKARALRDYGQSKKYVHDLIGLNSRLDELQAAILKSALLPSLSSQTARRLEIARKYKQGINNSKLKVIEEYPGSISVWHLFPILVDERREDFQDHLKKLGVSSGVHYPLIIPDQKSIEFLNISGDFKNARHMAAHEVSIPIHPYLRDEEVDQVISACNSW